MHPLLEEYRTRPVQNRFCGPWDECTVDDVRVGFTNSRIAAGAFDPNKECITVLYLCQFEKNRKFPEGDRARLKKWLPPDAQTLDARFYFGAGDDKAEYLRNEEILRPLLSLSDAVEDIGFFQDFGGVEFASYNWNKTTSEKLKSDVDILVKLYKAYSQMKPRPESHFCSICKAQFSDEGRRPQGAPVCPSCSAKQAKKMGKFVLAFIILVATVFGFVVFSHR